MPCLIRILTPTDLHPAAYEAESLADAARHEPHDGVYTISNTYATTQTLKLDAHLDRLEDSARREGIPLTLDRPALRRALRTMILEAGWGDVRFRITVGRAQPDHHILSIEPFRPLSPETYTAGVRCITAADSARQHPDAKTTDWMHDRRAIEDALPAGVFTALLLGDEGTILEGLSSNFYAVLDGRLRTAGSGVLPGISRQIVYEVAPAILPLVTEAVTLSDLPAVSEAFITSSSRGIVPVVRIDDQVIGTGMPGPLTARLREAYGAWVAAHLEAL